MHDSAPSPQIIRRVWAAVSLQPNTTLAQLGAQLGISDTTIWRALLILRRAGYIDYPNHTHHARTIIVPFIVVQELT